MTKTLFISLLFVTTILTAQKNYKLDSLFQKLSNDKAFNGNVLIAEKGKIIYQKSFGLANEATKEKLNENSIFELASVSKQFTAMAVVILKEKGKLNYDDKISKFLPQLSFYKNVTIRHLLNHTSGIPDYMQLLDSLLIDQTWKNKTKIATNQDILNVFEEHQPKLRFQPNEKWEYSNTGYAILGSIIEKVSGQTFEAFLKSQIFIPLQMNHTFVYRRRFKPLKVNNYAFGFIYSDSQQKKMLPDDTKDFDYVYYLDGIVGDGTVNSTAKDLLKWDRSLYSSKLISAKSRNEMFQPAVLNNGSKTKYGFGWFLENDYPFCKIVNHSGSWPGYVTFIERHIENDKTIILLQNNDTDQINIPRQQIRDILYDAKPLILSAEYLQSLSGTYLKKIIGDDKIEKNETKTLLFENGKLYAKIDETLNLELQPLSKTVFKVIGWTPEVRYEFVIENKIVKKYILTQPEKEVNREDIKIK